MDRSENNSGRLGLTPDRHREKDIDAETISVSEPFAKRLLDQWGTIWLFEVIEGRSVGYVLEHGNQRWQFRILFSARSKFEREAAKQGYSIGQQKDSR